MLKQLNKPIIKIKAIDTCKDQKTKQIVIKMPEKPSDTGGLCTDLQIAEGAKVIITTNIYVPDGLCNGVCGTAKAFLYKNILVNFENPSVGQNTLQTNKFSQYPGYLPIKRIETMFTIGKEIQLLFLENNFLLIQLGHKLVTKYKVKLLKKWLLVSKESSHTVRHMCP